MSPLRFRKPGFFKRDPTESLREEAEVWRRASPQARDRAFDGLCELAAEGLASQSPEQRARVLDFRFPMSDAAERRWCEIVRRERARRSQGQ